MADVDKPENENTGVVPAKEDIPQIGASDPAPVVKKKAVSKKKAAPEKKAAAKKKAAPKKKAAAKKKAAPKKKAVVKKKATPKKKVAAKKKTAPKKKAASPAAKTGSVAAEASPKEAETVHKEKADEIRAKAEKMGIISSPVVATIRKEPEVSSLSVFLMLVAPVVAIYFIVSLVQYDNLKSKFAVPAPVVSSVNAELTQGQVPPSDTSEEESSATGRSEDAGTEQENVLINHSVDVKNEPVVSQPHTLAGPDTEKEQTEKSVTAATANDMTADSVPETVGNTGIIDPWQNMQESTAPENNAAALTSPDPQPVKQPALPPGYYYQPPPGYAQPYYATPPWMQPPR